MLGIGFLALLATISAPGEAPPDRSVYQLHLAIDIPVTVLAGSVGLVRVFWKDELARKTCPCDPGSVNALDRHAIGNHSHAASIAGDVMAYGLLAAVPLADLADLGASHALVEDDRRRPVRGRRTPGSATVRGAWLAAPTSSAAPP